MITVIHHTIIGEVWRIYKTGVVLQERKTYEITVLLDTRVNIITMADV